MTAGPEFTSSVIDRTVGGIFPIVSSDQMLSAFSVHAGSSNVRVAGNYFPRFSIGV